MTDWKRLGGGTTRLRWLRMVSRPLSGAMQ